MIFVNGKGQDDQGEAVPSSEMSEEVLQRLKRAEEEAAALRKQLQEYQGDKDSAGGGAAAGSDTAEGGSRRKSRVDGSDFKRETLFGRGGADYWLRESQAAELLAGSGPGESGQGVTEEEQAIIQRRLLLGLVGTAGLVAFALVPTEKLRPRPSKPLFFYLAGIVRVQNQLGDLEALVADGEFDRVKSVLARMLGQPGEIQKNLENAIAWLDDTKTRENANTLAFDFLEYLQQVDYNKYFESVRGTELSGSDRARFVEFSLESLKAAEKKLSQFLALMPGEDLEAARTQVSSPVFG